MSRAGRQDSPIDHGGGIDAAAARWGGDRSAWLDLSTGLNPVAYPLPAVPAAAWTTLPDRDASDALEASARRFWNVPDAAAVLAAPGASALIARLPSLIPAGRVRIAEPTYNEHRRAFVASGWQVVTDQIVTDKADAAVDAAVIVHPNNPDGRMFDLPDASLTLVDESFCDVCPEASHIASAARPGVIILKSMGKFWGLAGLRLGFAMGDPALIERLAASLGPWPVSGPALAIGTAALHDAAWAQATRDRLGQESARLDRLMEAAGAGIAGGCTLFRLYAVEDAVKWQERLARHQIWSRIFPYSRTWLRLGLPGTEDGWARLERALA